MSSSESPRDTRWLFDDAEIARRREQAFREAQRERLRQLARPRLMLNPEYTPALDRRSGKVEMEFTNGERRSIMTRQFGARDGWPIVVCHGTPGSSKGPHPRGSQLDMWGIRLIAWDRPGYGESDEYVYKDETDSPIVADSATYVEAIAAAYGIKKCSVAGRSGGGGPALACAGELPDIVVGAAVFSSIAPADEMLDWYEGGSESNTKAYGPTQNYHTLDRMFAPVTERIHDNQYAVLESIAPEMSRADQLYLTPDMAALIAESHAEGLKYGHAGRIADVLAATRPWGFDPRDISIPVLAVQGEDDPWTPRNHFEWLRAMLPTVRPILLPDVGHMGTLGLAPQAYAMLREQARDLGYYHSPRR